MHHAAKLESVRRRVDDVFRSHGMPDGERFCETLLLRDGHYCGRRFVCEQFHAVWFLQEGVIKVFGSEGEFLESIQLPDALEEPLRKAA